MRVVAVANQKGGVGKTSVTVNVAGLLAARGDRVLVVDADPQADATRILGVVPGAGSVTLPDLFVDLDLGALAGLVQAAIVPATGSWPGVKVIGSSERLVSALLDPNMLAREQRLAKVIRLLSEADLFDVVLIDCPPSLDIVLINALVAADRVVVVTEPRASSVAGISKFFTTMTDVRQWFNPNLLLSGVVVNRHNPNRTDAAEHTKALAEAFDQVLVTPFIPDRELIARCATECTTLPRTQATEQIIAAFEAIITRLDLGVSA